MPKEKPRVNIGEVIKTYRSQRGLSQGDIERRTGLLRCYLSRVENGHTVPSLETLAKIAEAMDISLADFFPGTETPRDRETQKMLGELSQDEIRFLGEIKRFSTTLSDGDKRLVLAMIRKMATLIPPPDRLDQLFAWRNLPFRLTRLQCCAEDSCPNRAESSLLELRSALRPQR